MEKKTLILGVGNLLLKDEGVGIHVIRALEKETLPAHVTLMDGGSAIMNPVMHSMTIHKAFTQW